jgi:Predicted acetyltransferases and hydrolases with the alpha/beta hydrolase fold
MLTMTKQPAMLLVHGIFDSSSVMKPLRRAIESQGFRVYSPDLVPCDGSASIPTLAHQLESFIHTHLADERFSIIAFSMGGLIARYYLQCLNGTARAQTLITLGTPHNGAH